MPIPFALNISWRSMKLSVGASAMQDWMDLYAR